MRFGSGFGRKSFFDFCGRRRRLDLAADMRFGPLLKRTLVESTAEDVA